MQPTPHLRLVGRLLGLVLVAGTLVAFDHGPDPCGDGLEPLVVPAGILAHDPAGAASVLCTHGPDGDLHPAGPHQRSGSTQESMTRADATSAEPVAGPVPATSAHCYGDGQRGTRVHAIYAHEQGTPNRAVALDGDLRRWIGQVEWTVTASAARTGGRRHVRWLTEASPDGTCRVTVEALTLPPGSLSDLSATVSALAEAGYSRADRKYLVFADVHHGKCGIAVAPRDDRPGPDNRANTTVGYGRIDRDCWSTGDAGYYAVAAHELVHMLGGVQASAPHATEGRHCTDQWDVMCYVDGDGVSTSETCVDDHADTEGQADTNDRLLDCNNDDYFHTAPPSGSYLSAHWNVADSSFFAHHTSDGAGYSTHPSVAADPRGRSRVWSGDLGGAHRPLLADAYGWEACDLPIHVAVEHLSDERESSLIGTVLGDSDAASSSDHLLDAVQDAADVVNGGVGRSVVDVDPAPWTGGEPPEGTLLVRWGHAAGATHVEVTTRSARIRAATLTIDASVAEAVAAERELWVLQGMSQALGLGKVGGTGTLMAPYPPPGVDQRDAMAALTFLYAQPCDVDPRLDDTAPGHPAQRRSAGTRDRVDLATQAQTPVEAAVAVSAWLRAERGTGWASRAVVCRDDVHADCLAGTSLVGDAGPVLYVPGGPHGQLPEQVRDELEASIRTGGTITVLGGSDAVSDVVLRSLRDQLPGRQVHRIAGTDRFATAAAVARAAADERPSDHVILARADVPADAVAAGAAAAEFGVPVLLTGPTSLPPSTLNALDDLGAGQVVVTGGPAAVANEVVAALRGRSLTVSRLAGRTRNETAVAIARAPDLWNRVSVRASGSVIGLNGWHHQTWTLALAAAAVGAYLDAPVVFTTRDDLPSAPPMASYPGETAHFLMALPISGSTPSVTTVYIGGATWSDTSVVETFHGSTLPGFDGNVTVTASNA